MTVFQQGKPCRQSSWEVLHRTIKRTLVSGRQNDKRRANG
ncbi:hypothetical protein GJA_3607 [Janthinobacterium agaricidamnosum NBRC 102515 = DSM 9628]|uniref:Uncharacterized protein n=1 Tax=Janthinobacterium agaricidamnosum NBRC 102515 = DSM 9628 TaxID=1349767 RepID=W0VAC6_9BURK|nr:hypothetical protein GJA_3607 [Janthinobacterium agaricidamnosum NBRC 102515 = DSM 9628]